MTQKTALLGFHDSMILQVFEGMVKRIEYVVTTTTSVDGMLEHMGLSEGSPKNASPTTYAVYMMDVNLGIRGGTTIAPAQSIYRHVQEAVASGEAIFIGLSGRQNVVDEGNDAGIPCYAKPISFEEVRRIIGG
jgi:hypothetical protein